MKAIIYASELETIGCHTADFPDLETGGDLFGFWTHSGYPVIHCATGPGLMARRTTTSFYQDEAFLRDIGETLRRHHGLQHIGEWHSHHHLGLSSPSAGDAQTVVRGMQHSDLNQFFLTIMTFRPRGKSDSPLAQGYLFRRRSGIDHDPCGWVVLEGKSPIRSDERIERALQSVRPRSRGVKCQARPRTSLDQFTAKAIPLRLDSWARLPRGTALLKAVHHQLETHGPASLGVTPAGLVQAAFTQGDKDCRLIFENDTSLENTCATLQWSTPLPDRTVVLSGSMAEVLSRVQESLEAGPAPMPESAVMPELAVASAAEEPSCDVVLPVGGESAADRAPVLGERSACCDGTGVQARTGVLLRGVMTRMRILRNYVRRIDAPASYCAKAAPTCRSAVAAVLAEYRVQGDER